MVNLIGISGKKGVGKDTVGKIIQHLISWKKSSIKENYIDDVLLCLNNYIDNSNNGWEIKKFADKLKDIVCLLIGCTKEDLENEEFKSSFLSEEWNYWAGVVMIPNEDYDSKYDEPEVEYIPNQEYTCPCNTEEEALELLKIQRQSNSNYKAKYKRYTVRDLLQNIGTDLFRDQLHPNIWVNSLFSEHKPNYNNDKSIYPEIYPNWIITDVRFPNELEAIKQRNGIVIRVNKANINRYVDDGIDIQKEHESETQLDNAEFDELINNDGTIEELIEKVRLILIKYKII